MRIKHTAFMPRAGTSGYEQAVLVTTRYGLEYIARLIEADHPEHNEAELSIELYKAIVDYDKPTL